MFGASNLSDGRKCSFYSCQSIEGRCDESFLRFPIKNSGRCEQWVKNSGNITLSRLHIENLKNKFICEDHFDSESYHISGLRELLYAAAVPREYKQTIKLEEQEKMDIDEISQTSNRSQGSIQVPEIESANVDSMLSDATSETKDSNIDALADNSVTNDTFNPDAEASNDNARDALVSINLLSEDSTDKNNDISDGNNDITEENNKTADSKKKTTDSNEKTTDSNEKATDTDKNTDSSKKTTDSNKETTDSNKTTNDSNKEVTGDLEQTPSLDPKSFTAVKEDCQLDEDIEMIDLAEDSQSGDKSFPDKTSGKSKDNLEGANDNLKGVNESEKQMGNPTNDGADSKEDDTSKTPFDESVKFESAREFVSLCDDSKDASEDPFKSCLDETANPQSSNTENPLAESTENTQIESGGKSREDEQIEKESSEVDEFKKSGHDENRTNVGKNIHVEEEKKDFNSDSDVEMIEESRIENECQSDKPFKDLSESQSGKDEDVTILSESQDDNDDDVTLVGEASGEKDRDITLVDESRIDAKYMEKKDGSESILPNESRKSPVEAKETGEKEKYIVNNCNDDELRECVECNLSNLKPKYSVTHKDATTYICSEFCFSGFKEKNEGNYVKRELRVKVFATQERTTNYTVPPLEFQRSCSDCLRAINESEITVSWECLEFCSELCLLKYQRSMGGICYMCQRVVSDKVMGKYCVRFGTELKQFCSTMCLESNKKALQLCLYCQEDLKITNNYNFCSDLCRTKFQKKPKEKKKKADCSVCHQEKPAEIEFNHEGRLIYFCGDPCFLAYKFVNNVVPGQCEACEVYVDKDALKANSIYYNGVHYLCSAKCRSIYIVSNRKIILCFWCKVKKYNFDMVEQRGQNGQLISMCSVNCLKVFHASIKSATSSKKHNCDNCSKYLKAMYYLTMSDGSTRHFCSYLCLLTFQAKEPQSNWTFQTKRTGSKKDPPVIKMPVITNVQSLAVAPNTENQVNGTGHKEVEKKIRQLVLVKPEVLPLQRNVATMVKPNMVSRCVQARPVMANKAIQTDPQRDRKLVIPIPVPIYVPVPCHMYSTPVPFPVPFVLPVPVPIFIPTTRNSAKGILKEIQKIKTKVPADPLEAELLMMAEMVAEDKKVVTDSSSEEETEAETNAPEQESMKTEEPFSDPAVENAQFGEDMLQMALKMASDFEEPVDLEGAVSASTISAQAQDESYTPPAKRKPGRQTRNTRKSARLQEPASQPPPPPQPQPTEKPDANLCLKYTFGVNAWKQWVTTKNAEIERTAGKRPKFFKTEILQLTADELNFSLCLFVKEVRKPNGSEYAPDTIYYLCLGIQQYLYENGRIDNIFCDAFYDKFTDQLNEVSRKFTNLYNDSQYIVTRVEEEHLWESKQLGAHSPLVLINTLMFFNTKHFSLTTVEEHLQLSFSHIMKHWKRNPNAPGSRNVLLRFYPPQTPGDTRKKKMYEQQENEENPLRCPVKLYEFYLSKCPESVKTRNDVFYLLPERSCVPDSPLWYSTMALDEETLVKMLNRIKMVKEINVALLTS